MIGQTISHYKILEKLGEGGMGVVYKAQDTKLDRLVALKFLPPHLSASEQDKARFIQEAKAAASLDHANICTIYGIEEHEGQLFFAMAFVEGTILREKIPKITVKQAIDIGIQISDGLAAAHDKGIVHRDIKPENIMIRKDGIVQIMDFGLAKLRGTVTRLTKEGSTVGTAGYMSPEQVQGQDADHRSDIFSLGVLLYEMLTGQLPFRGVHETALAYEIVNVDAAPMSSVKPEIDPALDAIILECLEKDPNERTQSVKQVSIDLKRFKRESSRQRVSRVTAVRPIPKLASSEYGRETPVWKRLLWPAISGVLVIALAAAIWAPWKAGNIPGDVARFAIVLPKDRALASDFNPVIAISPDGQRIVFRASGKLYQRRLGRLDVEPILGTEAATSPFFSPDGRWLGFFAEGHLKKVPLMGGAPVTLADAPGNRGATWCSDGTIVFTPNGRGGLLRVKEDGTGLRQLTVPDTMRNERTHRYPQFLPDGKTVIFTVGTLDSPDYYDDATIGAVNLQTGERTVLLKGACMARYVSSGCLVYSRAGTLFAVPFDLRRLQVSGSSFPVAEDVFGDPTTGATHCSISENGTLVYVPGKANIYQRTLAWVDRNGAVTDLRAAARTYLDPRLSPDGNQVAVIISSGRDFDVWVFNIPRNTMSRLTFGGSNRSPVWSPDGKRIAYSYNATGNSKIIVRQADGSGTPEEFKSGLEEYDRTYVNCWTPDGSMLVVTVPQRRIGWDLMVLPLTGGRKPWKFLSTKSDEWVASLSPNGKWLAYISNETGVSQVFVRPFPGGTGQWQISADQAFETHWSIDGKMLYYNTGHSIMAVPIEATQSLVAGQASVLLKDYRPLSIESGITFDVSPDGLHLLVTKSQDTEEAPLQIDVVLNWTDEISKVVASTK